MQIPKNILPRGFYINKLRPFVGKNLIKVLTGQRRVGKSYLLFQLIQVILEENEKAHIIYINKEDLSFDFIKNAIDLNNYILSQRKNDRHNYIFIDEIQDIQDFEKALRSLLLDDSNDLYITGSNAKMLSGELATYLSGRYFECCVYSLSYTEFLVFHKLPDDDNSVELYTRYGGLPYLVNLPLSEQALEYIGTVYNTIVYRDVVARYNVRNTEFLERLVLFLADNIGSRFSAKKISDFLKSQQVKIAPNQVMQFSSYLASAYIVHEVSRYDIVGKRIFEIGSKFYFENTGIRNVITGYAIKDRGKLMENIVYNQLLYLGYEVKVGTVNGREIDFVAERNGERLYVQVAAQLGEQATIDREFGNLLAIPDNYPKIVVSGDHFAGNTYQGVQHMHIRDFLKQ